MKRMGILVALVLMSAYAAQADVNVLVATGQGVDFAWLTANAADVEGNTINYSEVDHTAVENADLSQYDILWIGWNGTSHGGDYLREDDMAQIADFVTGGGVVLTAASDDNGWQSSWLPANFTVLNTGDYDLAVTDAGQQLFTTSNVVDGNALIMDERYATIDPDFTILAWETGKEDSEAAFAEIGLGKGLYVLTSLDNRNDGNAQINGPMMINMLAYAIDFLSNAAPVEPAGKLATTWSALK